MKMEKTLDLYTQWGYVQEVKLEINKYANNNSLYIGLNTVGGEYEESYGDITVNFDGQVPDYCAFLDMNNLPEAKGFIEENKLGEFTGITKRSGFCEYPLYIFNPGKLKELCPEGMAEYEKGIIGDKVLEQKPKSR